MSMNLNSKQGAAGITTLLVIAIIFVVNYLVGGLSFLNFRVDLTQDKLYTLSDGTRNILSRLNPDEPVTVRYYVSTEDRVMPPMLKTYARTVQDLLLEYQKAAGGRIIVEKLAPNPNTEDEDKAREDQIQGMQVNAEGDNIYLGLAIQSAGQKEVIPFLNPAEETALEYNLSRSIAKVIKSTKTVIGVMSAMPIQGSPMYPFQRQQGQAPWIMIQRLRMDYEVREVPMGTDKIDSDISVLVVVHPADIAETAEYAIDQYVLKGGKVVAFVDPQSWIAQAYSGQQNPMTGQPTMVTPNSDLPKLFSAWGVGYKKDMVVADVNYLSVMQGRKNPTALRLPADAINKDDRITAELQTLVMMSAGAFSIDKKDGLTATPLVTSSEASEMIDTTESEKLRRESMTSFNPSGRKQVLAVRLTGKFKTAFPSGKPKPATPPAAPGEAGGAQDDATKPAAPAAAAEATPAPAAAPAAPATPAPTPAPAPAATTPAVSAPAAATPAPVAPAPAQAVPAAPATPAAPAPAPAPAAAPTAAPAVPAVVAPAPAAPAEAAPAAPAAPSDGSLTESANTEGVVVLVSDVDMVYDAFSVQQDPMTGGVVPINSNLPLFLNAVELLAGGGDLLSVRSRASTQRRFTKLNEMREAVERNYRPQLQSLQTKLDETAQKISSLRVRKDAKTQTLMIDPQQQKDIQALMDTQGQVNRQIREIKKEQNKQVDFTQFILTWLNILGVPLVVIVIGLLLAMRRRDTTAAV